VEDSAEAQQQDLAQEDYKPSVAELQDETERWSREFGAAKRWLQPLKDQAKKIEAIIRDERELDAALGESRWNLFAANRETKAAMLYGRPPRVSVERRFSDEADDVARVASDITTRILNTDIERTSDGFATALGLALLDRLDCGWSMVRERYVVEWEHTKEVPAKVDPDTGQELAPAVPAGKRKKFEDVETDYVHLADQLWQPCRFFHEMGWWAQKTQPGQEELIARFGEKVGKAIPLNGKPPVMSEGMDMSSVGSEWKRADLWEIWDKDRKKVIWYVEGYGALDCKKDPYGLEGFYPFPRPMVANPTTSKYLPRPDYVIAQDLYTELNLVTTRIRKLMEKGVRVTGLYAKQFGELADMFESTGDGVLLPVDNWDMSGNGVANSVYIFPTAEIVACVLQLRDYRRELIDAIAQVTGMADIMRGEATQAGATATEQRVKTRMGSVRMQAIQDDFARFASEAQQIRAQLIAKFFDEATIAQRSNAQFLKDQQLVPQAVALIKSPGFSQYRIEVKSEAISLADFAATKAEKFEAMGTLSQVFQMAMPLAQAMGPAAMPFVFKVGKATIAGMRGVSDMESAFDEAAQMAEQQAEQAQQQGPPPDPKQIQEQMKMQTAQQKAQLDIQKEQLKHNQKLEQIRAEVVADDQREASQATWNAREAASKAAIQKAFRPPEAPKPGGMP
jgi:hypothetical protein